MSELITPDFGRSPVLQEGDIVSLDLTDIDISGLYPYEVLQGLDRVSGIVYSIDAQWDPGVESHSGEDIGGQAVVMTLAIPGEEEWYIIPDVKLSQIRRLLSRSLEDYDLKVVSSAPGKVLQFDPEKRVTPHEA